LTEEYSEEEYITSDNDPHSVEHITQEDYTLPIEEEVQSFEEIFETVRATSEDFTQYDKDMEKKMLDSLRRGEFSK